MEKFYDSVRMRVTGVDTAEGRQKLIVQLYDTFFATAFKKTVDKLGIVYTPIEIVDFILRSADEILRDHFGQGLSDEGVHILDGFVGTGTFIVRLLQLGLIRPEDLVRKYAHELWANEIMLLAYYIAAVNIETTFQDLQAGLGQPDAYEAFPGLVLTDTFQSWEDDDTLDDDVFIQNNQRLEQLKKLDLRVLVGNPPYSSGQDSANDDNANEHYPHLDQAIDDTYGARSTARLKTSLHDSYIRAIKWASLRLKDRGMVAYVTNGGWIDSNSADGMRLSLADEFSDIHIYNLKGNALTSGDRRQREGGGVFGAGSKTTVAITILVKDPDRPGPARIHYIEVDDYLKREEKLRVVADAGSFGGLSAAVITPNGHGDWINQRCDDFATFIPLGDKDGGPAIFDLYSRGVMTCRDAWVYNFDRATVEGNMRATINFCNQITAEYAAHPSKDFFKEPSHLDDTRISWDEKNRKDVQRGRTTEFKPDGMRTAIYRPFVRQHLYLDRNWNNSVYRLQDISPDADHRNMGIYQVGASSAVPFSALLLDDLPDLHVTGAGSGGQFFPRWRYEAASSGDMLDFGDEPASNYSYRKIDNIADVSLRYFKAAYGDTFTEDDVFFYCYGLLHSPAYRELYKADLKKVLPRIPLVTDPWPYVEAGRRLSELHTNYESVEPYPLEGLDVAPASGQDPYDFFRVQTLTFPKVRDLETKKLVADKSRLVYNSRITLAGIPAETSQYMLGSKSALDWIVERYSVSEHPKSKITNDPNAWSREVGNPRYILDLIARIVTVSVTTVEIVAGLPDLEVLPDQPLEDSGTR